MSEHWWLVVEAGGTAHQVQTDGRHPREVGYDIGGSTITRVAAPKDMLWHVSNEKRTALIEDLSLLEQHLIAAINVQREVLQGEVMTAGDAKKVVYAAKDAEVRAWDAGERDAARLPYAAADAARAGDGIDEAIERFRGGAAAAHAHVAKIEAAAADAIRMIRVAKTSRGKLAAADIDWRS